MVPWIIAAMAFLTGLALALAIGIGHGTQGLTASLDRSITVQIVEPDQISRDAQAEAASRVLRATAGVSDVRALDDAQLAAMLQPWLGNAAFEAGLPIPAMIDARLPAAADVPALARRLSAVAPAARIETHRNWAAPVVRLARVVQWLALGAVLLVMAALAAVVAMATRAGLNVHRPTIEVLHLMGAEDRTLALLFQYRYAVHGLVGGAAGAGVAAVVVMAVLAVAHAVTGAGNASGIGPAGWAVLAMLPLFVALLTMLTARLTVLRLLDAMP